MASTPEERPASPPPVTWLAEPLKRFHDEAWHTPQGRLVREIIFEMKCGNYKVHETIPWQKTVVPPACTFAA